MCLRNVYNSFIRFVSGVIIDLISFYLSLLIAFSMRKLLSESLPQIFPPFEHAFSMYAFYFPFPLMYLLITIGSGLYSKRRFFWEDVREFSKSVILYSLLIWTFLSISRQIYDFSRTLLILHNGLLLFVGPFVKYFLYTRFINKIFPTYVYYIGSKGDFKMFKKVFLNDKYLGFKLGDELNSEYIFISDKIPQYKDLLLKYQKKKRKVFILEEKRDFPPLIYKIHLKIGENILTLEYENKLLDNFNIFIKRSMDYIISILLLPFFILVIAIIAILIKLDSPGPIFYLHERVGKDGRKFKCIKFRTMYEDADEKLKELLEQSPELKRKWEVYRKLEDDPRITRVGKFLRKTSLDELPQIINVLKGDMSLVGPRPVTEEELNKYYGEFKEYYLSVYPGITGLWQVSGRNKLSYKERVYLDIWYVLNWSVWIDLVILLKTIREILKPSGI